MTQYPEAYLCRELGMAVVNISLITDYDAGVIAGTEAVNAHSVIEVFERNSARIRKVVLEMIERFPADLDALGARDALAWTLLAAAVVVTVVTGVDYVVQALRLRRTAARMVQLQRHAMQQAMQRADRALLRTATVNVYDSYGPLDPRGKLLSALVRSLATAAPLSGVELRLIARNNEVLATRRTDAAGG